jgi:secreted PhoX family phosphatase
MQDIFIFEDGDEEQFVRGLILDDEIYDFAQTISNDTEFYGATFDPDGQSLYLNQQGERGGSTLEGPSDTFAVTYAIYGPFEKRAGVNNENFGNGPGA